MQINWQEKKGTALLVAMLVMAVLMTVSVLLSRLILRETMITKNMLDAGRAYYAAESGVELALYELAQNLPGWQPAAGGSFRPYPVDAERVAVGEYRVDNRCGAYPCFEEGFDLDGAGPESFYNVLDLNESVNIPLFTVDEEGAVHNVQDFTVEFFATFDPKTDLDVNLNAGDLSGWDVLRWKVFGINGEGITETISDFSALSMLNQGGEQFAANARQPSWLGTRDCDELEGRYNDDISCVPYYVGDPAGRLIEVDPEEFGQVSKIYAGTCAQTQAREYYAYQYFGEERDVAKIEKCYSIAQFLRGGESPSGDVFLMGHSMNYLSLTNLINPAVFKERGNEAFRKLYYRVEFGGGDTAREYADVVARGYSGASRQSISVQMKEGSFMPVFNFSLYSTYRNSEE